MSPRTLVLGSTGLFGQSLMRQARLQGREAAGVARHAAGPSGIAIDLRDACAVVGLLNTYAPDLIINAAAQTDLAECEADPARAWQINTVLPAVLASWCGKSSAQLVHISTDHYYCGNRVMLHPESTPVTLVNNYARQKFNAEELVATCPGTLVVRTNIVGVRGWRDRPTFAEWAIAALRSGKPFRAFVDMWTSSIDSDSLAAIVFDLADRRATGLMNVAARHACSKHDFIVALARSAGLDAALAIPSSIHQLDTPRRANSLGLDVSIAEAFLGHRLPELDSVIERLTSSLLEKCHAG